MASKRSPTLWSPTGDERIIVLQGPDAFLRSEYAAAVRTLLTEREGEVDVIRFDGQSHSAADVLDECRSFGLMQQHKIVLVDQADQLVKEHNRPLMERYAAAPCDAATLILRSDKWNRGKLDALITKVGAVVPCKPMPRTEGIKWMAARTKSAHKASIEPSAAGELFDRMDGDLGRIDTELAKLAVMATADGGKARAITLADVLSQSGSKGLDKPWDFQGPLLSGDASQIVRHLRRLLEDNPKDLVVPISWAMIDLAGNIHQATSLVAGGMSPGAIGGRINMWPAEKAQGVARLASRLTPGRTLEFYRECVRNDRAIKSGLGKPTDRIERVALGFARLGR